MSENLNPLVLIGVGSSFALSAVFYGLYQEKRREVQELKKIPVFKPDQQLVKLLKASPFRTLQYVAVEGLVQADGQPLASKFVPQCFGVIQRITAQEHWKVWNAHTKTWSSQTRNHKETNNAAPMCLVNPDSYITDLCVKVQAPFEASGCFLETVHHRVRQAEEGLLDVVVQGLSGEKPVALEEKEELLRVGSNLTCFGEVVLEGGQVMMLQVPRSGRKFLLVPSDYKSFMEGQENSAVMWKTLTAACAITGASLLGGLIYHVITKKDRKG